VTNPSGQLVIFRWTIAFDGCCIEILVAASQEPQISPSMFRIRETFDLSALGAPQSVFALTLPPGTELINEDHIIVYFNNAELLPGVGDFGWSADIGAETITHDTAFDPAELPPESVLVYEYWVRSI
jgi:hypothetical protein